MSNNYIGLLSKTEQSGCFFSLTHVLHGRSHGHTQTLSLILVRLPHDQSHTLSHSSSHSCSHALNSGRMYLIWVCGSHYQYAGVSQYSREWWDVCNWLLNCSEEISLSASQVKNVFCNDTFMERIQSSEAHQRETWRRSQLCVPWKNLPLAYDSICIWKQMVKVVYAEILPEPMTDFHTIT